MKSAHRDPVDHSRTTQPHAGESFIDTLWLPGLGLILLGTVTIAGFIAATAYGHSELTLPLGFLAGALVTAGAILIAIEHQRVKRVEKLWWAEHPRAHPRI
ncbi:UsfY protein [Mycolicibacterium madagascariense]|uniref:UsfY protein n=1 Tax=Mycolicibacterium madagascariense TaxID=212765 RepID=A0A7I7XDZ0_9MYCO|nr:protein UsfY [Mycolicibacterium madagascariense]MCV7011337.1 LapA family protein [Mycolicibacterium madagascariense]BBZ26718.1 UsfY protein [Mycolicibacterium madagascariense]